MAIQTENGRPSSVTTLHLVREALDETKELIKLEVLLAKNEAKRELVQARASAIAFGVATAAALLGLAMLLVAVALAIDPRPRTALVLAVVLLIAAGAAGRLGYMRLPKKLLDMTRKRLESDVHQLKEHVA